MARSSFPPLASISRPTIAPHGKLTITMNNCLLLCSVFLVCSISALIVTNDSQVFIEKRDSDNILPECTKCTDAKLCDIESCYVDFDESSLLVVLLNDSCFSSNVSAIIPPEENDSVSLEEAQRTCGGYSVVHRFRCLVSMPVNLCQFPATKKIDFSGNRLKNIPNLSCLTELVILNLRWNSIGSVPRDAFVGLTKLRDIFLDYNQIVRVDPFAFSTPLPHLNNVYMSYNKLETVEPWFMNIFHPFCTFSLANNHISRFTNEQKLNIAMLYQRKAGPGFVDFSYNKFHRSPTAMLQTFGVRSYKDLVTIIDWGFDFQNNPIVCDCELFDLLSSGQELFRFIERDYFNIICVSPPELRGLGILQVPLDKLVCNVTDSCPHNCTCEDRPSKEYVHVDCAGAGLTRLPDVMPLEKQLSVMLANNSIEVLEARDYLERLVNLDLTFNGLKNVDPETPPLLQNIRKLDLRGNQIAYLPENMQILPTSAVALDPYSLSCDCRMLWFSSWRWLSSQTSDEDDNSVRFTEAVNVSDVAIFCLLHDGTYISMTEATKERLACIKELIPVSLIIAVGVLAGFVLCVVAMTAIFRYEILVLYHVFMSVVSKQRTFWAQRRKPRQTVVVKDFGHVDNNLQTQQQQMQQQQQQRRRRSAPDYTHDVFISCAEKDVDLDWVINRLLPMLDQRGVKSYLLARDCPPGVVAVDEAVKNIRDSHVVLVVLSTEYAASATCLFQFSQAYNLTLGRSAGESVKKDRRRLLVLEVDRNTKYSQVGEPHLKAMLRMRMTLCADNPRDMERVGQTFEKI